MKIKQNRGFSIATLVMYFFYKNCHIDLLYTTVYKDFSEETYIIFFVLNCFIILINIAKGIEICNKTLMNVIELHDIPILIFINELDRESKDHIV
ncbi:MAG: GTP-binding protein [Buchnera aphidicola (Eriosoma harunire)]